MANSQTLVETRLNHKNDLMTDSTRKVISSSYNYEYIQRDLSFSGEGHFFVRRINFDTDVGNYQASYLIPGNKGLVRYFHGNNLQTIDLAEGSLPLNTTLFIETDKHNMIISQAYSYNDLGYGTKDAISNLYPITVTKEDGYFKIKYRFKNKDGHHGIFWGVGSQNRLINFNHEANMRIWANYDLDKLARLGEDGYYYKSPSTYTPSRENSYWRNPSMYAPRSWVNTGGSLASSILGKSYLLIGLDNINEENFLATLPQSNWLKDDYNIGHGFFDTRFNADMGDVYLAAYKKFRYPEFKTAYERIVSYYTDHIMSNHYTVYDDAGDEGWLVEDYGYKGEIKPVHVSLNHQIFAANWYLKLYEFTGVKSYEDIALKMLQGIKNTRDDWIKDDNNLEYAYMADGSYGLVEYPYLTYNDLYNFQVTYSRIYGFRDKDLDILMNSKKQWMDKNEVTEYKK